MPGHPPAPGTTPEAPVFPTTLLNLIDPKGGFSRQLNLDRPESDHHAAETRLKTGKCRIGIIAAGTANFSSPGIPGPTP